MQSKNREYPLVSIIVPAYNMADYICETIDSIRAISYPNWEAVIVDDGSQDATFEVAVRHTAEDKRFRVERQENMGVCAARNFAIMQSRGAYILPLDADDLLMPDFIGHAVEALERDTSAVVVRCDGEFFEGREGRWRFAPFNLQKLATENQLSNTSLFRADHYHRLATQQPSGYRGLYDERIPAREDWEFWISMLKEDGEVIHLDEVGFRYRVRGGSRRFSDRRKKREVVAFLNRKHADFFERMICGPLYTQRSHSLKINQLKQRLIRGRMTAGAGYDHPFAGWIHAAGRLATYYPNAERFEIAGRPVQAVRFAWRLAGSSPSLQECQLHKENPRVIGYFTESLFGLFMRRSVLLHAQ